LNRQNSTQQSALSHATFSQGTEKPLTAEGAGARRDTQESKEKVGVTQKEADISDFSVLVIVSCFCFSCVSLRAPAPSAVKVFLSLAKMPHG